MFNSVIVDFLLFELISSFDHITVEDSLASRRSISTVGSEQQLSTDAGAFNVDIETEADGIIDFSEGNPFGDAT